MGQSIDIIYRQSNTSFQTFFVSIIMTLTLGLLPLGMAKDQELIRTDSYRPACMHAYKTLDA